MKSLIADRGRVMGTDGSSAIVRLEGGAKCRKCGMAAIGLCKPGGTGMLVRVENPLGAEKGDVVKMALDRGVHLRGYFFAYMLPLLSFVAGAFVGHLASLASGLGGLDAPAAFLLLGLSLVLSVRKIRALDRSERMYIRQVVREVPEFEAQGASSPEGLEYLRAYRGYFPPEPPGNAI
jgi:sigma-E factor negative regulatory protein RseC